MSKIEKITPQIAALYLGAKCDLEWLYTDTIDDLFMSGDVWRDIDIRPTSVQLLIDDQARITPHLRRMESITEAEALEIYQIATGMVWTKRSAGSCLSIWWLFCCEEEMQNMYHCIGIPQVWLYLLSKGVDLFGLIEAGLAKEIKPETTNS